MILRTAHMGARFAVSTSSILTLALSVWLSIWLGGSSNAYAANLPSNSPPIPIASPTVPVEAAALSESLADATNQSSASKVDPLAPVHRSIDEELLLQVRMHDLVLADALPGYLNGSSLLLPLGSLAEILEFPIRVDPLGGTASGWFIRENKLFYMNVLRASVVVEGHQGRFDSSMVEIHSDDIYIDTRLLSQWFPIDITFDISNMGLTLASREALPFERKLLRDEHRKIIFANRADKSTGTDYPFVKTPPKLLSWPMLSVDTNSYISKPQNSRSDFITNYNILSSADMGFMNAELFAAGDNRNKITESRLRFERKDPSRHALGNILGTIPLTEMAVGDIYSPAVPLVARTQIGRGMTMSSIPLDTPAEFDKITLTGNLTLGWEMEVFRNEVLIAFQSSRDDGRYNFTDIPLLFGVNVLKLVFYGPQGQTREEIKQFRVGAGLIKPGQAQYRITANQHDARVLYKRRTQTSPLEGERRLFGEAQVGITRNVTAGINASLVPSTEGQQKYLGLSSSTSIGDIYTRGDVIKQAGKGWAGRVSGQTALGGVSIIAQHDYYRKYFSEYVPFSTDPLTNVSKIRLDGSIPKTILPRLQYGLTLDHSIHRSKARETRLTKRLSMALGRASVTNNLTGSLTKSAAGALNKSLSGSFLLGGRIKDVRIRSQVAYQVAPIKEISTMSLNGDWHISEDYQGRASMTRTLGTINRTAYSIGANTSFDQVSAGFAFDYGNNREMTGRMTLNFSFSRDPSNGGINMARGNIATKGAMSARVYLDNDASGTFTQGDEPLNGVGFTANKAPLKGRTGDNGFAYITGIEPYKELTVKVDLATLNDPYWIAQPGGIRVVPRPGTTGKYEFPVVSTGEIDGSAFRAWADGTGSAAGVIVQLVNAKGEIVREVITAYDGFFLFDFVVPGDYTLRVSPNQLQTLKLSADQVHPISIKGNGTIISDRNFILR